MEESERIDNYILVHGWEEVKMDDTYFFDLSLYILNQSNYKFFQIILLFLIYFYFTKQLNI